MVYIKKTKKIKKQLYKSSHKSLKGGKYIDEGGFGCVIRPALPCNHLSKNLNLNNYVSKIISNPDHFDDIQEEIQISTILKQIDPYINYFLTIKDSCYITKLPNDIGKLLN